MAKQSYPVVFSAEYRGPGSDGGQFTREETGEVVSYGPQIMLERESMDGELCQYQFRLNDSVEITFDPATLKRGEMLTLAGEVVLNGRAGYFRLHKVERTANGKPRVPAGADAKA